MLDPADCGPAFIAPAAGRAGNGLGLSGAFFEPTIHEIPRPRARHDRLARSASKLLKKAKRPLIIAGGGVRYSRRRR